jgi:branched-chain amino acid transport system permease protein
VLLIGIGCAIPVCMLVGYSMERFAYRPLRGAPRLAPLITAIGISIILQHLAMLVWSRNVLAFPQILETKTYMFGGTAITNVQIAIIAVCFAMMAGSRCSFTARRSARRCAPRRRTRRSPA